MNDAMPTDLCGRCGKSLEVSSGILICSVCRFLPHVCRCDVSDDVLRVTFRLDVERDGLMNWEPWERA